MSETELTKARERNVVARLRDVARRIATNNTPQPAALTAKTISDLVDLLESCLDERDAAADALQQALAERDEALEGKRVFAERAERFEGYAERVMAAESNVARLTAALSAETEACAKVAVNYIFDNDLAPFHSNQAVAVNVSQNIAAAIRQRQGERS